MKYTNKYNGHTYFIENGVVMFSSDGIIMESYSSVSDFNRMIELGELVPVKPTRENFRDLVNEAKKDNPGLPLCLCVTEDKNRVYAPGVEHVYSIEVIK